MGIDCKVTMHYRLSATQAPQRLRVQLLTMASWMQMCPSSSYPPTPLPERTYSHRPGTWATKLQASYWFDYSGIIHNSTHQHSQQISIKNRSTEYTNITLCLGTWELTKIIDLQCYSTFDYPNLVSRVSPRNLNQSALAQWQ